MRNGEWTMNYKLFWESGTRIKVQESSIKYQVTRNEEVIFHIFFPTPEIFKLSKLIH